MLKMNGKRYTAPTLNIEIIDNTHVIPVDTLTTNLLIIFFSLLLPIPTDDCTYKINNCPYFA